MAGRRPTLKLHLSVRKVEGVTVLYGQGRISYGSETAAFSERIAELLPRTQQLVIELSGVEVIDSAGLGELVLVLMWAQAHGCSIKLASAQHQVQDLLELTNLASVFEIHPTLDQALLCFQGQAA
jgi:anti-sigma B factor antagonist